MPRPHRPLSQDEYRVLRERFSAPEENYELLSHLHPVHGRRGVWDGDFAREQYIRAVDHMIGVLDGTIGERARYDDDHRSESQLAPEVVVWLDKSARPVSWFVDAFWSWIAQPDAVKPHYEFLRIDRRDWLSYMGYSDHQARSAVGKRVDITAVPDGIARRMRAWFVEGELDRDTWEESIATSRTRLDGKRVLVVDETSVSGATLEIACALIKRIVPTAIVSAEYFWRDETHTSIGGHRQPGTVPIWYPGETTSGEEVTVYGRGVGNSSLAYWQQLPSSDMSFRGALAHFVLSVPHHDPVTFVELPDELADKLLQDIAFLTYDLAAGSVLHRPSADRFDESYDETISRQRLDEAEYVTYCDMRATEIAKRVATVVRRR